MPKIELKNPKIAKNFVAQRQKLLSQELEIVFTALHDDILGVLSDMKAGEVYSDELLQKINGLIG